MEKSVLHQWRAKLHDLLTHHLVHTSNFRMINLMMILFLNHLYMQMERGGGGESVGTHWNPWRCLKKHDKQLQFPSGEMMFSRCESFWGWMDLWTMATGLRWAFHTLKWIFPLVDVRKVSILKCDWIAHQYHGRRSVIICCKWQVCCRNNIYRSCNLSETPQPSVSCDWSGALWEYWFQIVCVCLCMIYLHISDH